MTATCWNASCLKPFAPFFPSLFVHRIFEGSCFASFALGLQQSLFIDFDFALQTLSLRFCRLERVGLIDIVPPGLLPISCYGGYIAGIWSNT